MKHVYTVGGTAQIRTAPPPTKYKADASRTSILRGSPVAHILE
jgi:hypothetical protein